MPDFEDQIPTTRYQRGSEGSESTGRGGGNASVGGGQGRRRRVQRRPKGAGSSGNPGNSRQQGETRGRSQRGASRSPQASTLKYGDELGKYIITGFAGRGATSFVYRARPRQSFDPVAIKVLHPSMVADPTRRKAFFKEARMMLQLDHANVVDFHRILEADGYIAFVMEYIDGVTLESWLEKYRGRIDQSIIAALFADILRGVRHAHENGVLHRDLKPSNIMITQDQNDGRASAKIIDFGVARGADEAPSRLDREKIRGTAAYMSPEEINSPDDVSEASDLYSIGVMLYEAAAGARPFESSDPRRVMQAHASRSPASPSEHNPTLAPELEFVILKTLAKSPDRRFKDAREMISALELGIRGMQAGGGGGRDGEGTGRVDIEQVVQTTEWQRPDHLEDADAEQVERWHRQLLSWLGMVVTILTATGKREGDHDPHFLSRGEDASARGGL